LTYSHEEKELLAKEDGRLLRVEELLKGKGKKHECRTVSNLVPLSKSPC